MEIVEDILREEVSRQSHAAKGKGEGPAGREPSATSVRKAGL